MKKKLFIIVALILILTALTFAGCDDGSNGGGDDVIPSPVPPDPQPSEEIVVSAKQESILIHESNFADFDFTTLFVIKVDGRDILIQSAYLDLSHLPQNTDEEGYVTCLYGEKSATCNVRIEAIRYALALSKSEITLTQIQIDDGFDFLALFNATADGQKEQIEDDMIRNGVKRDVGDYTYNVTYHGITKSLIVHVSEAHRVEIVNSYNEYSIEKSQLNSFDFTELFSLYVDGVAVKVEESMLDIGALSDSSNVEEGNFYDVSLSYRYSDEFDVETSVAKVKVVAPKSIVLTTSNIVTYPNGGFIDLTELFTIKDGDEYVPVTIDMISGDIDYSNEGINNIVLTYKGQTATATITVKRGVMIDLIKGDTIIVKKGTNKIAYNFAGDVSVLVNGLVFSFVTYGDGTNFHIDTSNVDFDTVGSYDVTVRIPYRANSSTTSIDEEKTFTYVVKENTYELSVVQQEVTLAQGTESYNVFQNVAVRVNGIKKNAVPDKEIAKRDPLAVWAQLVSTPIDFSEIGTQHVKIAVYPEGADTTPVYVEFDVRVKSGVDIISNNKVVFVGDTVYVADLFTIKDGDNDIKATADMIEGKVDTFKAGVYTVTIDYLGLQADAKVIVFSDDIVGAYKTNMTTIPSAVNTDYGTWDSSDDDMYYSDGDDYEEESKSVATLKDMTFSRDGSITVNGMTATVVECISEKNLVIATRSDKYDMYIDDGIVFLNPDNSLRMSFSDTKRPLVYFSEKEWELKKHVIVNSGKNYVLSVDTTCYSIDTFNVARVGGDEVKWFGLYVKLVSRISADSIYSVSFGEASYPDGFVPGAGVTSTLTYDGTEYDFTMSTAINAKVQQSAEQKKYAGMTFTGTFDGDSKAKLSFDSKEWVTLKANSKTILSGLTSSDVGSMVNGGFDYDNDIVFLYKYENDYYSYKFKLDVENNTFEYIEKDNLYGYYEYLDKYIYLDGYGTGIIKMDGTSYTKVSLSYTKTANEIKVKFIDAPYTFTYGEEATFYLATFGNVLTVKQMEGGDFVGAEFTNSQHITSGALVSLDERVFANETASKTTFFNALHIITADGELSATQKQACTDTSAIKWTTPGFYQFSITLELNGESITAYYSVQILYNKLYLTSTWINASSTPVVYKSVSGTGNTLTIDKYGRATFECGEKYTGYVNLSDENKFYTSLKSADGNGVQIACTRVSDGLVSVRATGSVLISDYFTTGTVETVGGTGAVIRKITCGSETTYLFSTSATGTASQLTDAQTLSGTGYDNGATVTFTADGKTHVVKIVEWGNGTSGLTVADSYRGTYTCEGAPDLIIDGFGNATLGTKNGTYTINTDGSLLVTTGADMCVLVTDSYKGTYKTSGIRLDNTLTEGKTYAVQYIFICPNDETGTYPYSVTTTFAFGKDGTVTVTSVSTEHDSGDAPCTEKYNPSFVGNGTYAVSGNVVTVNINGAQFIFKVSDVSLADELVCTSTTLDQTTSQGAFKVGEKFSLNN